MIDSLVSWLDAESWRFWLVALAATVSWLCTLPLERFGRRDQSRLITWIAWTLATFALLLAWRWPYLVGPAILNPDEAQMIAGAITLKSYPVFWKYVDGTTHGPLVDLALLATHAVGAPLNYGGARLTAGVLVLGGWILAGRGLMPFYPAAAVRVGLAPVMLLWASIAFFDFAGYTSEQVSIFLFLSAIWPLASACVRTELSRRSRGSRLVLAGFMLGCLPYAKLQSIPIGLALGAIGIVAVAGQASQPWAVRLPLVASLVVGALGPTVVVGIYLAIWGLTQQFWHAYILNNILYASTPPFTWDRMIGDFWEFLAHPPGLRSTVWIAGALVAAAAFAGVRAAARRRLAPWLPRPRLSFRHVADAWSGVSSPGRWLLLATFVLAVSCLYATLAPRRPFGHYLQFVGIPVGLVSAIAVGELWPHLGRRWTVWRVGLVAMLLMVTCMPLLIARIGRADPDLLGWWTQHRGEWRHPASIAISQLARPGDTLSVWGWMPCFYVETGLPHATREAHTHHQIEGGAMLDFYRERYLRDFTRRPPRIFVDAVGGQNFGYGGNQRYLAHESFEALRLIIEREYRFVEEVGGTRIYVRKETTTARP